MQRCGNQILFFLRRQYLNVIHYQFEGIYVTRLLFPLYMFASPQLSGFEQNFDSNNNSTFQASNVKEWLQHIPKYFKERNLQIYGRPHKRRHAGFALSRRLCLGCRPCMSMLKVNTTSLNKKSANRVNDIYHYLHHRKTAYIISLCELCNFLIYFLYFYFLWQICYSCFWSSDRYL